jgi:hypothetical protein
MAKQRKAQKPTEQKGAYYYRIECEECVLCGHVEESRTRVYGTKPTDGSQYSYRQTACGVHFC